MKLSDIKSQLESNTFSDVKNAVVPRIFRNTDLSKKQLEIKEHLKGDILKIFEQPKIAERNLNYTQDIREILIPLFDSAIEKSHEELKKLKSKRRVSLKNLDGDSKTLEQVRTAKRFGTNQHLLLVGFIKE